MILFGELDVHVALPAAQSGAQSTELPTVADPALAATHCAEPVLLAYVPAEQAVHVACPAVLDDPAGHARHRANAFPPEEKRYVPAGHGKHVPEAVAPVALE